MTNMELDWLPLKDIPASVSITAIIEYKNMIYAGSTEMSDFRHTQAVIYVSDDQGTTWKEFVKVTEELSTLSTMLIKDDILIVAGRKGQVNQEMQGGVYKASLSEVI